MNTLFVKNYITNDNIDLQDLQSIPPIVSSNIDLTEFRQPILEQCGYKMPHPLKEEIEFKPNVTEVEIDLTIKPQGVYIVNFHLTNGKRIDKKIIKLNIV